MLSNAADAAGRACRWRIFACCSRIAACSRSARVWGRAPWYAEEPRVKGAGFPSPASSGRRTSTRRMRLVISSSTVAISFWKSLYPSALYSFFGSRWA